VVEQLAHGYDGHERYLRRRLVSNHNIIAQAAALPSSGVKANVSARQPGRF
jgi:hypothetical protein